MAVMKPYQSSMPYPIQAPVSMQAPQVKPYVAAMFSSLARIGEEAVDYYQQKKRLEEAVNKKYQEHLDDLTAYKVKNVLAEKELLLESVFQNEPFEAWEGKTERILQESERDVLAMLDSVSPERREFLLAGLQSFREISRAKMESLRLKTAKQENQAALLSTMELSLSKGESGQANLAAAEYLSKWRDFHASYDEAVLTVNKYKERGEAEYRKNLYKEYYSNYAEAIRNGAFLTTDGVVDLETLKGDIFSNQLLPADLKEQLWASVQSIAVPLAQEALAIQKEQKKQQVYSVRQDIAGIIDSGGDVKAVIPVIDGYLSGLAASGVITEAEKVEYARELTNWADDYASERKASAEKEKSATRYEALTGFLTKMTSGEFITKDEIFSEPALHETDRKNLYAIVDGMRDTESPAKTDYSEYRKIQDSVFDFYTGKLGEAEAREMLLRARYVDKVLSDKDFKAFANSLNYKIPPYVAVVAQKALQYGEESLRERGFFFGLDWLTREEKRTFIDVSSSFLRWLKDTAENSGGVWPSEKAMLEKLRAMNLFRKVPYEGSEFSYRDISPEEISRLPVIFTDEQYDALKSGDIFINGITGERCLKP